VSGIYVASKAKHGNFWRTLRDQGYPICSTWIDECEIGETVNATELWSRIINEVSTADALVHLLYPREIPKGAFVEVGAALASAVPVFWVGRKFYCRFHPLVTMCSTLDEALERARGCIDSTLGGGSAQATQNCAVDSRGVR
jgi:hypothetical protein